MVKNKSDSSKFALGAVLAAVAGFIAGLLTAPKSGKETREDIKDAAGQAVSATEKELKVMHTQLNELVEQAKDKGADLTGKAKKELDELVSKADVSRQKAREVLSGIHEGDAEDADLSKAIKDSKQAIENLKTYLKK